MPQNGNQRFHNKLGYCVSFFSLAKYKCSVAGVERKFLENKDSFFGEPDLQFKLEVNKDQCKVESCQGQGCTKWPPMTFSHCCFS